MRVTFSGLELRPWGRREVRTAAPFKSSSLEIAVTEILATLSKKVVELMKLLPVHLMMDVRLAMVSGAVRKVSRSQAG